LKTPVIDRAQGAHVPLEQCCRSCEQYEPYNAGKKQQSKKAVANIRQNGDDLWQSGV
jgi:hypothetical protein